MATPGTDSEAIKHILRGLLAEGYTLSHVWDGEEEITVTKVSEAMEAVMAVDTAHVHLKTPEGAYRWVWFDLGNSPEEFAFVLSTNLDPTLD